MLNPVAMSIITNTFTVPRERAQAVGIWGAVVGVSMALGPVVGAPRDIGRVAVDLLHQHPDRPGGSRPALRYIPESRAAVARKVDVPGQLLVIAFLSTLTYGIT